MITVNFKEKNGVTLGYKITGHSGYGEEGTDIICASVSSVACYVANTITDVMHISADIDVADGYIDVIVSPEDAPKCADLFNGLKLHIKELKKEYTDYIV